MLLLAIPGKTTKNRMMLIVLSTLIMLLPDLSAIDFGFRFKEGYCQKNSRPGFNPNEMGQCGMLTISRFVNQKLQDLDLKGANLSSSYLYMSEFSSIESPHLALKRSVILQSQFKDMNLDYVDLRGSQIKGSVFQKSSLKNALASGARFNKTRFIDVNFEGTDFWGAQLHEVDFINCDLRDTDLKTTSLLFNQWTSSRFNAKTRLPFSKEEALQKGMIYVE